MAIYTKTYLRQIALKVIGESAYQQFSESYATKNLLVESNKNLRELNHYDVFLSNSYLDQELVLGIKIPYKEVSSIFL